MLCFVPRGIDQSTLFRDAPFCLQTDIGLDLCGAHLRKVIQFRSIQPGAVPKGAYGKTIAMFVAFGERFGLCTHAAHLRTRVHSSVRLWTYYTKEISRTCIIVQLLVRNEKLSLI